MTPEFYWAQYNPGEFDPYPTEGDIILVHGAGRMSRLIRWVTRGPFNHAAVVVKGGTNAMVAQEAAKGSVLTPLSAFVHVPYVTLHITAPDDQRDNAVAFAKATLGSGYGFLTIVADLFNAVTGIELDFGLSNRMVCSTQAMRTLERFGVIPKKSPAATTPQDIADQFGITLKM